MGVGKDRRVYKIRVSWPTRHTGRQQRMVKMAVRDYGKHVKEEKIAGRESFLKPKGC